MVVLDVVFILAFMIIGMLVFLMIMWILYGLWMFSLLLIGVVNGIIVIYFICFSFLVIIGLFEVYIIILKFFLIRVL